MIDSSKVNQPSGILTGRSMYDFSIKFASPPKSVSFADPIVAEVNWRQRTEECEKFDLFYSALDIEGFRREYRTFRRLNRSKQCEIRESTKSISLFGSSNVSDARLLSEFIYGAVTYASDQVNTLQETVTTNFIEVLNAAAESKGNETVVTSFDFLHLIDAY